MPQTNKLSKSKKHITGIPDEGIRCTHTDTLGRQCRALSVPIPGFRPEGSRFGLCPTHATADRQLLQTDDVAKYLFKNTPHLDTAAAVNHFLEHLVEMVANNRIPVRNATLLTYISSLLLSSVDRIKDEFLSMREYDAWQKKVVKSFCTIDPHCLDDLMEDVKREMIESGQYSESEVQTAAAEVEAEAQKKKATLLAQRWQRR
jgi:hypothetical protein